MAPPHIHCLLFICSPMWSAAALKCITAGFQTHAVQLLLGLHACLASTQNAPPCPLSRGNLPRSPKAEPMASPHWHSHIAFYSSFSEHIFNPFRRTECVLLAGSLQAFLAQWSREESRPISDGRPELASSGSRGYAEKHLLLLESVPSSGDSALCLAVLKVQEDSLEMRSPHLSWGQLCRLSRARFPPLH